MDGYLTGPSWLARIIFVSEKLVHMYMEAPPIFDSYKLVSCDLMAAGRWYSPSSHITLFSTARERERESLLRATYLSLLWGLFCPFPA